jgi:hypothetical protein
MSNVTETLDVNPPQPPKRVPTRALVPAAALFVWIFELAASLLLATPVHAWALSYFGAHPDGDALVFRPGGYALLSWLGDRTPALPIVVRTTILLLAAFALAGRWFFGFVTSWLASHGARAPTTAARAFVPLVLTGALAFAAEAFVVSVGLLASSAASAVFEARLGDARAFFIRVVVLIAFAALLAVIHVFTELADTALVLTEPAPMLTRVRAAAVGAYRALRAPMIVAWVWRSAGGIALLGLGSVAGDVVGARGGTALALLFVAHQALALGRAALRVSWLDCARRAVQRRAL